MVVLYCVIRLINGKKIKKNAELMIDLCWQLILMWIWCCIMWFVWLSNNGLKCVVLMVYIIRKSFLFAFRCVSLPITLSEWFFAENWENWVILFGADFLLDGYRCTRLTKEAENNGRYKCKVPHSIHDVIYHMTNLFFVTWWITIVLLWSIYVWYLHRYLIILNLENFYLESGIFRTKFFIKNF